MLSQADEVVEHVDISLNSEYETIRTISEKALQKGKIHKIVLMIDLGDLREGVWYEDAVEFAGRIIELPGVKLVGVGTNLTCYGAVIPSRDNLGLLTALADEIEKKYNLKLNIISGGNSSSLHLVEKGQVPKGINQLRLGEGRCHPHQGLPGKDDGALGHDVNIPLKTEIPEAVQEARLKYPQAAQIGDVLRGEAQVQDIILKLGVASHHGIGEVIPAAVEHIKHRLAPPHVVAAIAGEHGQFIQVREHGQVSHGHSPFCWSVSASIALVHRVAAASEGMSSPPRGEREIPSTWGPSGRQLRLNWLAKKRLKKPRIRLKISWREYAGPKALFARESSWAGVGLLSRKWCRKKSLST